MSLRDSIKCVKRELLSRLVPLVSRLLNETVPSKPKLLVNHHISLYIKKAKFEHLKVLLEYDTISS